MFQPGAELIAACDVRELCSAQTPAILRTDDPARPFARIAAGPKRRLPNRARMAAPLLLAILLAVVVFVGWATFAGFAPVTAP